MLVYTLSGNSTESASFCDFIFDWNLTQHVLNPTHIRGNILDLVLTSEDIAISHHTITSPCPFINYDHFLFSFCSKYGTLPKIKNSVRYVLDYSKADVDGLCSYLLKANFNACFKSNDVKFVWNTIKQMIYDAMDTHIPKVKLKSYKSTKL